MSYLLIILSVAVGVLLGNHLYHRSMKVNVGSFIEALGQKIFNKIAESAPNSADLWDECMDLAAKIKNEETRVKVLSFLSSENADSDMETLKKAYAKIVKILFEEAKGKK